MPLQKICLVLAFALIGVLSTGPAWAIPVYDVQAGFLRGINNVDVGGTDYDVTFVDGVFEDLFNLADPFVFNGAQATQSSQALSLLLIDGSDGFFDTDPLLTFGCAGDNCQIRTPYEFQLGTVSSIFFRNAAFEGDDEINPSDFAPGYDSSGAAVVFADWNTSRTAAVPEPSTLGLLGAGLLGLFVWSKRAG